jgi:hypothetical protein
MFIYLFWFALPYELGCFVCLSFDLTDVNALFFYRCTPYFVVDIVRKLNVAQGHREKREKGI